MKRGLVCVGFGMIDLCDVLSFIAIYRSLAHQSCDSRTNHGCVWRHLVTMLMSLLEPTLLMLFYMTQQLY